MEAAAPARGLLARLAPLYLVVFVGFLGYSLMITVFTPMLLRNDNGMLPASSSTGTRTGGLGVPLALYPLGQFLGAPVLGSLSDRLGRRRVLIASLAATTSLYIVVALALETSSLALLMIGCFAAGVCESNVALALSGVADLAPEEERSRLF